MTNQCDKLRIGEEFLSDHDWPSLLRKSKFDRCYCEECYSSKKEDTMVVGGHEYVIPRGWTRFGVYVDEPFAKHHHVWKTWANCYHGTSIDNAKSIVEHRQLLLPRDVTLDGKKLQIREGHIPGEYFFFTTPTIQYASLDCYAYTYEYKSSIDGKDYEIKVALQCKQKSDSFVVQPETVGARGRNEQICKHVSNEEMEWKTQQRSSIMPYGLMLQIRPKFASSRLSAVPKSDTDRSSKSTSIPSPKKKQTVNCPHCSRDNVWENGGYYEGRTVTCCYENCKKKFQQLSCPHCSTSNVWKNADYKESLTVTCWKEGCKKKFQQISCPNCLNSNVWKNAEYKQGLTYTCCHDGCKKKFQQVSCPHCSSSLIWKNADYKEGLVITCSHDGCKKKFQQLCCPHCSGTNVWKNADYKQSITINCCHDGCKKKFQQISCPHCSISNLWKNANYKEGLTVACCSDGCKKKFQQVSCPHCSGSNVWKNADYKEGTVYTCCYENCKKKFQQISCPHCSGSNVWKNADYEIGRTVKCCYESCGKSFQK